MLIPPNFALDVETETALWERLPESARQEVARVFLYKALSLAALGHNEPAIAALDEVLLRFDKESDSLLQMLVGESLLRKAQVLGYMARKNEAIEVLDYFINRQTDLSDSDLGDLFEVAKAAKKELLKLLPAVE
jgi:tetratricopeptide (TPR) repeat protein